MKRVTIILLAVFFAFQINAQEVPAPPFYIPKHRKTQRNDDPTLVRRHWPVWRYVQGADQDQKDAEDAYVATLTGFKVLKSYKAFWWARNCHDFAWGPFMSCLGCDPTTATETAADPDHAGQQKEAWWMNDPRPNWKDLSMEVKVVSVTGPKQQGQDEYLFTQAELDGLENLYYDSFLFERIGLPVCNLDDLDAIPGHTAVLVDYVAAPQAGLAYGIYHSKWGFGGLYKHRWGVGYISPAYDNETTSLRLFAPKLGWGSAPPYDIWHTAWGE
jgi:hypothetical protein